MLFGQVNAKENVRTIISNYRKIICFKKILAVETRVFLLDLTEDPSNL